MPTTIPRWIYRFLSESRMSSRVGPGQYRVMLAIAFAIMRPSSVCLFVYLSFHVFNSFCIFLSIYLFVFLWCVPYATQTNMTIMFAPAPLNRKENTKEREKHNSKWFDACINLVILVIRHSMWLTKLLWRIEINWHHRVAMRDYHDSCFNSVFVDIVIPCPLATVVTYWNLLQRVTIGEYDNNICARSFE